MEREACVCDHGFERSELCAEIIIIIIIITRGRNLGLIHGRSSKMGKMGKMGADKLTT